MLDLRCPSCSQLLGLRLLLWHHPAFLCRACKQVVRLDFLSSSGVPAGLIKPLEEWELKTPAILHVGMTPEEEGGLEDREYVRIWREVFQKTQALVAGLRAYLVTDADVLDHVFNRHPADRWTDDEIIRSRRWLIRLHLIGEYGATVAQRYLNDGGTMPEEGAPVPGPLPKELHSEEEREEFARGFRSAAPIWEMRRGFGQLDYWRLANELADLERQLGIKP